MSCGDIPSYNPLITPDWLSEIHGMDIEEAKLYCNFCRSHTIRYKGCYGFGEIMLPMWQKELREAKVAVRDLMNDI